MPRSSQPAPAPATKVELRSLLTKLFGREIFVDTQNAKKWREIHPSFGSIKSSGWHLRYDNITAGFAAELPYSRMQEIAESLRQQIHFSDSYTKKRERSLPPLTELISDTLDIRIDLLRNYVAKGVKIDNNYGIQRAMNLAVEHEKDWRNFQQYCLEQASQLIVGRANDTRPDEVHGTYFQYEPRYRMCPAHQWLYMLVDTPIGMRRHPTMDKDAAPWQVAWKAKDIFRERAIELGIDHLFKYEFFHEGTHAPRDEDRIIMNANSPEGLIVKLAELAKPDVLAKVQTYFREVIREIHPANICPAYSNELWEEATRLAPEPPDLFDKKKPGIYKKWSRAWEKTCNKLVADPRYAPWIEITKPLMEGENKTVGDMIEFLRNPPAGKEAACAQIKAHILEAWPLLAVEFEQPTVPPRPQPSGPADAPQMR